MKVMNLGILVVLVLALVAPAHALTKDQIDQTLERIDADKLSDGEIIGIIEKNEIKGWRSQSLNSHPAPIVNKIVIHFPEKRYSQFRSIPLWTHGIIEYSLRSKLNPTETRGEIWYGNLSAIQAFQYELEGKTIYLLLLNHQAPSELKKVDYATYKILNLRVTGKNLWVKY